MTIADIAEETGQAPRVIRNWINRGELVARREGKPPRGVFVIDPEEWAAKKDLLAGRKPGERRKERKP